MAKITIGRVRPAFVGTYDPGTNYKAMDCVTYNGASYAAKQDVPLGTDPTNTTYWQLMSAKGDTGPQGLAGPQGPQGPTGATGAQGPIGLTGPQGQMGPQGPQGETGPPGADGADGVEGPMGPQGVAGPAPAHQWSSYSLRFQNPDGSWGSYTNLRGAAGATGPQGPQGVQGLQGEQGLPGAAGPQGPEGPQGPAGPQGPEGPTGAGFVPDTAISLGTTYDLNTLFTPGFYYQTSNANTSGRNYPVAKAGSLLVQKSAGQVTQLYVTYDNADIYTRSYYTSWSAWELVLKGSAPSVTSIGVGANTLSTAATNLRATNASGYVEIGPKNTTYCHMYTDRSEFYFNKNLRVNGNIVLHTGMEIAADDSGKLAGQPSTYYRCSSGCSWTCSTACTGSCMAGCTGCSSCTGTCSGCTSCSGTCTGGCGGSCDYCKNA